MKCILKKTNPLLTRLRQFLKNHANLTTALIAAPLFFCVNAFAQEMVTKPEASTSLNIDPRVEKTAPAPKVEKSEPNPQPQSTSISVPSSIINKETQENKESKQSVYTVIKPEKKYELKSDANNDLKDMKEGKNKVNHSTKPIATNTGVNSASIGVGFDEKSAAKSKNRLELPVLNKSNGIIKKDPPASDISANATAAKAVQQNSTNTNHSTQNILSLSTKPEIKPLAINLPKTATIPAGQSVNKSTDNSNGQAQIRQIMQFGQILHLKNLGDGLRAWVLEKNQRKIVLYTTPNQKLIISGMVWDAKSKKNLTQDLLLLINQPPSFSVKEYLAQPNQYDSTKNLQTSLVATKSNANLNPQAQVNIQENSQKVQTTNLNAVNMGIQKLIIPNQTPSAINQLKNLAGIEEKTVQNIPLDTFYIFFDPRCSYCDRLYQNTRDYVKKGYAIKWIPAILMGEDAKAYQQAAYLLQQNNPQILGKLFSQKYTLAANVSDIVQKQLVKNRQYFLDASQMYKISQPGIPAALFFDKRVGAVRMVLGIAEPKILQEAFLGI